MSRDEITKIILAKKIESGIKWEAIAAGLGRSKEWTTAACLGQMKFSEDEAQKLCALLDLDEHCFIWLQTSPTKGQHQNQTDPLLYRFYEVLGVYGPALKELIHEEFGDGIMSAIDFTIKVNREPDADGDRVEIVWSGKFLPYKKF